MKSNKFWIVVGIAICLLINQLLQAYFVTLYFDGFAADGVFQVFNPLRRLAAGQQLGEDFQFFHGIGTLLLHYPGFKLLGSNLFASELTRWVLTVLSFQLGNFFLLRALRVPLRHTILLCCLIFAATPILLLDELSLPNNGAMGIRAFWPLAAIALLLWMSRLEWFQRRHSPLKLALVAGLLAAFALFMSSEHGLALSLGLMVVVALYPWTDGRGRWSPRHVGSLAVYLLSLGGFLVVMLATFTGRHTLAVLEYNFQTVSLDQFWYFGVPPNPVLFDFGLDWAELVLLLRLLLALGIGYVLIRKLLTKQGDSLFSPSENLIVLGALVYGVATTVSNLGYTTLLYSASLWRLEILILLSLGYHWLISPTQKMALYSWLSKLEKTLLVGLALFVLVFSWQTTQVYHKQRALVDRLDRKLSGVYLSRSWSHTLDVWQGVMEGQALQTGDVWSTYASLLEANYGIFHPDTDYIIHALGPQRRDQYIQAFIDDKPRFVQTMINSEFSDYGLWLQGTTWDFYDLLINNYAPIAETSHSILWQINSGGTIRDTRQEAFSPIPYEQGSQQILLKVQPSALRRLLPDRNWKLALVKLDYEAKHTFSEWPILGRLSRFMVYPENTLIQLPTSLPPYRQSVVFPVYLDLNSTQPPLLTLKVWPPFGGEFKVNRVSLKIPDLPTENEQALLR